MQTTQLRGKVSKPMPTTHSQPQSPAPRRMLHYLLAGPSGSMARQVTTTVVLAVGAALVATTGAIHLHLWAAGYRTVPTIGPLFIFQGVAGAVIAVGVVATRRLLAVLAAAGFMIATIGGLLLSVYVGLFGFMDSLSAPFAGVSLAVESIGAVVLAGGAILLLMPRRSQSSAGLPGRVR